MTDSSQTENIWAAFAAAQAEFSAVTKNKKSTAFGNGVYRYADLQSILDACRPALNRHGLFLTQRAEVEGTTVKVETIVTHVSGESLSSGVMVMTAQTGGKISAVQAMGSALTYARRYSLAAFLGVAADDDDDGNAAGGGNEKPPKTPPFVLTQDMVAAAKAAAAGGVEAYKGYYQSRPEIERTELSKSGWHKTIYEIAKAADAAKEAA